MRFVKRIICLLLILSCVLFTGCNSILYNGNLKVEPYAPPTLPVDISQKVEKKVEEVQQLELDEKYEIEGTNAFYFLPEHENKPEAMIDFKVLDYRPQEGFIYCYKTPYYGSAEEGDLGLTAAETGIAPEERVGTETKDSNFQVTVLMSYRPDTRAYHVFFTHLEEQPESDQVTQNVAGVGELSGSINESQIMAHKLANEDLYFLFIGNKGYLFNPKGEQTWSYDYSTVISQEVEILTKRHQRSGYRAEVTISNVVMDGSRYVYIPVSLQLEKEDGDGLDLDSLDANDQALENTSFHVILSCYNLDIGPGNSENIVFTSENENWEAQREEWLKDDGKTFEDWESLENYLEENSMTRIKMRSPSRGGDRFPVFATVGHSINMELAGIENLLYIDGYSLHVWILNNLPLIREKLGSSLPEGYQWWHVAIWSNLLDAYLNEYYFWNNMSEKEREEWVNLSKALLALKAMESGGAEIPGIGPGIWNGFENAVPLPENGWQLEALFAAKTSVYEDGSAITRYADVQIPGRYKSGKSSDLPLARVETVEYTPELERTFYYEEEETYEDENGDEHTRIVTYSYSQIAPAVPLKYQVVFPEGTTVFWVESQETDAQVSPSGGFGALYLSDLSDADTADEDFISRAVYDDGLTPIPLSDSQVRGKSVDGGIYYYGNAQVAAVITNTGITFYERSGRSFKLPGKYISLDELSRSGGLSIAVTGEETLSGQISAPELEGVGEEQDAIIDEKLESGSQSELFDASDLTMLNEREFLISSMYNGMILYNLRNNISIHLEDGAYFASFPLGEAAGNGRFMVVGYQTTEYSYQPSDIAWAKCYEMDLGGESSRVESEALMDYVDRLADEYLSRIHRVSAEGDSYVPAELSQEELEANAQAERLFFGSQSQAQEELRSLMDQHGFDIDFETFWEHTSQLRDKLQNQKTALSVLYELAGLPGQEIPPSDGQLLEIEGRMIRAAYTSNLENLLVELALTDEAVGRMDGDDHQRYEGYQESQKLLGLSGSQMNVMENLGANNSSKQVTKEDAGKAQQAVEETAYYQAVLKDLEERFQAEGFGQANESWEDYLQRMLSLVSPDYSTNTKEEGIREFCQIAGISQELTDLDELGNQLSQVRQVWELEELIVSMKASSASYQNAGYQEEYETYENTHYASDKERQEAFRKAGFYRIIADLQVQNREYLEEQEITWDELLEDIIKKCGSGIVLNSGT